MLKAASIATVSASSPRAISSLLKQIRLHFRCLVREHKFGKLGWHLIGIRRALFLSDVADRKIHLPRTFSVPLDSSTPLRSPF